MLVARRPMGVPVDERRIAVRAQQRFFTIERMCPSCQGLGRVVKNPCKSCTGSGRVQRERTHQGDPLLHAARHVAARDVPLLGINRGRLGFLTDISPESMLQAIDAILGGDYLEERRAMLAAKLGAQQDSQPLLAVNDIVLQKGETGHMLDFTTVVDGVYVNTHRGDGLIVAGDHRDAARSGAGRSDYTRSEP